MGLVVGIDGGGTSSRIRIADADNQSLWEGRGEAVNPNAVGYDLALARLSDLIRQGLTALHEGTTAVSAACLGLAGVSRPDEVDRITSGLVERLGPFPTLRVVTDAEIALVGGLKSLSGLMLLAGTGSIALARTEEGTVIRAGGLGHWLGDEGSAFYLGFEALRRGLRSLEGRDLPTNLVPALLPRLGLASADEAIGLIYHRFDKALVASTAGLVLAMAEAGDPLATDIEDRACDELVRLVTSVHVRSGYGVADARELLLWGGLLQNSPEFSCRVAGALHRALPGLTVVPRRESAEYGACLLALADG